MLAFLIPWPVLGKNTGFPREELKLKRFFITVLSVNVTRAQHLPCPKCLLGLSREYRVLAISVHWIGLQYLGPVFVKEGKGITKMWICLFTCLAVRVVHLEWVRSLSAEHFLLCLRRFMWRRGKPKMIISDNAAQFKLVKNVVDKQWRELILDEDLLSYLLNSGIQWQFTTALPPSLKGLWD